MGALAEAVRSYSLGPWASGDKALASLFGGGPTASGQVVNEYTALNLSAVWSANIAITGPVASLPLFFFKRTGATDDKEKFVDHTNYRLVHDQPNSDMTAMVFRETLQSHALMWGNAYAEIQRDAAGRPVALWPITPDRVEPYRTEGTRELRYRVSGNADGRQVTLMPEDILHIPGLGFDGTRGYSVIYKARESLGLVAATEKFGATFFGNGAHAGGVALHPGKLSSAAKDNIRESIDQQISGARSLSTLVLEEGMKWERRSIPPDDAQFLETRRFQVVEVARWFNVPPHKLKDLERATFSNIEQQSIEFVTDSLMPWLVRWEQELNRKLIRPLERRQQFFKHNVNALLRGDSAARAAWYTAGRQWGWFSANDVLRFEDENGIGAEGDIYLVPTNMAPADRINDIIDKQVAPTPVPVAPSPPAEPNAPTPARVLEAVEALRTEIVNRPPLALPEPVDIIEAEPDTRPDEILQALRALPLPPDLTPVIQATEGRLRETVETAGKATAAEITARLATQDTLRRWQHAAVAMIAGRLVRREIAQAKKIAADPERAAERLGEFYRKFAVDAVREIEALQPGAPVQPRLEQWSAAAQEQCLAALADGGMATVLLRWVNRHDEMTTALLGVLHGE